MRRILSFLREGFLDLIYPSNIYCISCGNIIDDSRPYALCDACVRMLKWANGRTCSRCGKILQDCYELELCSDCLNTEHAFEKGYACVEYGSMEREILHQFKYKDKAYLGRKLAEIMFDRIRVEELKPDFIIPVPMFASKKKTRGYNQAAVLAKSLAEFMERPYAGNLLNRVVETAAMSGLGAAERRRNIQEAFVVSAKGKRILKGKVILLIDDIFTTGSTADACSMVLLKAGAGRVFLFTFAAGANLLKGENELDSCN